MGKTAGFEVRTYTYYDPSTKGLNFQAMYDEIKVRLKKISKMPQFCYIGQLPESFDSHLRSVFFKLRTLRKDQLLLCMVVLIIQGNFQLI